MTSDDPTPEITNLPRIVMAPNHSEIYSNGRWTPVVPDPPLPAAFKAWLAEARRLGYYRRGPISTHAMNFPNGDEVVWMSPRMDQWWSRAGERPARQSGFDTDRVLPAPAAPINPLTLDRMRRTLAEMYRRYAAADLPLTDGPAGLTD